MAATDIVETSSTIRMNILQHSLTSIVFQPRDSTCCRAQTDGGDGSNFFQFSALWPIIEIKVNMNHVLKVDRVTTCHFRLYNRFSYVNFRTSLPLQGSPGKALPAGARASASIVLSATCNKSIPVDCIEHSLRTFIFIPSKLDRLKCRWLLLPLLHTCTPSQSSYFSSDF